MVYIGLALLTWFQSFSATIGSYKLKLKLVWYLISYFRFFILDGRSVLSIGLVFEGSRGHSARSVKMVLHDQRCVWLLECGPEIISRESFTFWSLWAPCPLDPDRIRKTTVSPVTTPRFMLQTTYGSSKKPRDFSISTFPRICREFETNSIRVRI